MSCPEYGGAGRRGQAVPDSIPDTLPMKPLIPPLGWAAGPTRTGHTKAVGTGDHAGEVLYGQQADWALHPHAQDDAGNGPASGPESAPTARTTPGKLFRGESITANDVHAFAAGAAGVPLGDLQAAARVLAHRLHPAR